MTAAVVDPNATVESDRRSWIDAVAGAVLADGSDEHLEEIAGVPCRWVSPIAGGELAIIVYAHGGGLTAGSSVTHAVRFPAPRADCKVLLVDYHGYCPSTTSLSPLPMSCRCIGGRKLVVESQCQLYSEAIHRRR